MKINLRPHTQHIWYDCQPMIPVQQITPSSPVATDVLAAASQAATPARTTQSAASVTATSVLVAATDAVALASANISSHSVGRSSLDCSYL